MDVIRLTKEEKAVVDAIGWFAIFMYCEREQSFNYFDIDDIDSVIKVFNNDDKLHLHKIIVDDKEVGRFGVREGEEAFCLTGLVIYKKYRNKGYFKRVLDYLLDTYKNVYLFTSNKHMAKVLFKDNRFKSNGWEFKQHTDDFELRFESK